MKGTKSQKHNEIEEGETNLSQRLLTQELEAGDALLAGLADLRGDLIPTLPAKCSDGPHMKAAIRGI